jgi:uridine kinase
MDKPYTIGITGGSGSGKTYFIEKLSSYFKTGQVCLLSQDHYYKPIEQQYKDAKGIENFDLPEAIDNDLFLADIRSLKAGQKVLKREYTFNKPDRVPAMLEFAPAPVLVVEGLFIFMHPEIEQELDLKIFIEAKDHVKLTRRIRRDNEERGYDLHDVLYRYENHVMPVYESFIQPLKHECDIIIPNNKHFERALEMLVMGLRSKV